MPALRCLSSAQAAALIGASPRTLEAWRRRGTGPIWIHHSASGHPNSPGIRYPEAALLAWLAARNARRRMAPELAAVGIEN